MAAGPGYHGEHPETPQPWKHDSVCPYVAAGPKERSCCARDDLLPVVRDPRLPDSPPPAVRRMAGTLPSTRRAFAESVTPAKQGFGVTGFPRPI